MILQQNFEQSHQLSGQDRCGVARWQGGRRAADMSETTPNSDHPLRPLPGAFDADAVLDRFLSVMAERGLELYPEQEEAILEFFAGSNVVLNTPTGSGKSLVASAAHFKALCA